MYMCVCFCCGCNETRSCLNFGDATAAVLTRAEERVFFISPHKQLTDKIHKLSNFLVESAAVFFFFFYCKYIKQSNARCHSFSSGSPSREGAEQQNVKLMLVYLLSINKVFHMLKKKRMPQSVYICTSVLIMTIIIKNNPDIHN